MKRVRFLHLHDYDYFDDLIAIVEVFSGRGFVISVADARDAWLAESDAVCAGWLILPDDGDLLFDRVMSHCTVEDDGNAEDGV